MSTYLRLDLFAAWKNVMKKKIAVFVNYRIV